ncbi:AbrB/MazE/SpoVT family DNA-binding domain-containing protein [Candidatus Dependentiae bacterium]|nr:AbrB/MazE/SpoVT family DNA-binding domain-containing protein [Candidatus Dependentiae bacterium]
MIRNLVKHGENLAIVLDKQFIESLNLDYSTSVDISTDGRHLIISPIRTENQYNDIMESLNKVNINHSDTLQKLGQ